MNGSRWQLGSASLFPVACACAFLAVLTASGCGKNRMFQSKEPLLTGGAAPAAGPPPVVDAPSVDISIPEPGPTQLGQTSGATAAEMERLKSDLERNNESLHQQLAVAMQKQQTLEDQVKLLQGKLGETVTQLRDTQVARDEADRRAQAILASAPKPSLTANNSVTRSLQMVEIPGVNVRQDGDLVRVTLPSDRLFNPGSVEWVSGANTLLDHVASSIARSYPRQRITIEAHTDSSIIGLPGGSQQLAASQALAVYQHLTAKGQLPAKQLVTMAYGPNFPRVSNATDEGRAKNRRIELVIYPEQIR